MSVEITGPLFNKNMSAVVFANLQSAMEEIADSGAEQVRIGYEYGQASRAPLAVLGDRVSDHIVGRTTSRIGRKWVSAAVIQVYNEGLTAQQGRSLMAAASYLEGWSDTVLNVAAEIDDGAALRIDLTAGLE